LLASRRSGVAVAERLLAERGVHAAGERVADPDETAQNEDCRNEL